MAIFILSYAALPVSLLTLLQTNKPSSPPKAPPVSPKKGKDRGAKASQEEASSSIATTSSRPRVQKTNPQAELTEDDSFYDEAFGLWV